MYGCITNSKVAREVVFATSRFELFVVISCSALLSVRSIYKDRDQRLNWAKKKLVKYLRSKGERVPTGITFTRVVNLITGEE